MKPSKQSPLSMFWNSTIGLKITMAVSGFVLVGFLLFHMLGNLQVFAGPATYNAYADFMYGLGELAWFVRFTLFALLVLHVASSVKLAQHNRAARVNRYAVKRDLATNMAAKTMLLTGLVIAAYLVYHIAHFTVPVVHTEYMNPAAPRDVYTYFVRSFQSPVVTITYVLANVLVAAHVAHASSSMFRTLGLTTGKYRGFFDRVGPTLGIILLVGNLSMPLACLFGIITA